MGLSRCHPSPAPFPPPPPIHTHPARVVHHHDPAAGPHLQQGMTIEHTGDIHLDDESKPARTGEAAPGVKVHAAGTLAYVDGPILPGDTDSDRDSDSDSDSGRMDGRGCALALVQALMEQWRGTAASGTPLCGWAVVPWASPHPLRDLVPIDSGMIDSELGGTPPEHNPLLASIAKLQADQQVRVPSLPLKGRLTLGRGSILAVSTPSGCLLSLGCCSN